MPGTVVSVFGRFFAFFAFIGFFCSSVYFSVSAFASARSNLPHRSRLRPELRT